MSGLVNLGLTKDARIMHYKGTREKSHFVVILCMN